MSAAGKSPAPWCCELECSEPAEFEIYGSNGHPDNHTQACARHVGELLGTPVGQSEDEYWTVHQIGGES